MRARALIGGALLAAAACDEGYFVDQDEFCRRRPTDPSCPAPAGAAGASGSGGGGGGGSSGVSGRGGGGTGGGGGSAGADGCDGDAQCTAPGSLCVTKRCSEPSASCTKSTRVVVTDPAFAGPLEAGLEGACFYRALAPALAAAGAPQSGTTRVLVYAAAVAGPAAVPVGVRLEGRATAPAQLVALTAGGAGGAAGAAGASGAGGAGGGGASALVTLGDGAALAGFALDGKGSFEGVTADAGAVRLEGPLTIANATRAIDLGGTADATVTGTEAAPVRLSANRQGIVVGATATLIVTGDGDKGGVTIEGTTAGAGVLVLAGDLTGAVTLEGLLAKDNKISTVNNGTGAVEVRQGRSVTIKNGVFEGNLRALTLNGELTSDSTSFSNVVLEGNRFVLATPGQGSAICGSQLGSQTQLRLGPGNVFPLAMAACPPAQVSNCNGGADVGHDTLNDFFIQCPGN